MSDRTDSPRNKAIPITAQIIASMGNLRRLSVATP